MNWNSMSSDEFFNEFKDSLIESASKILSIQNNYVEKERGDRFKKGNDIFYTMFPGIDISEPYDYMENDRRLEVKYIHHLSKSSDRSSRKFNNGRGLDLFEGRYVGEFNSILPTCFKYYPNIVSFYYLEKTTPFFNSQLKYGPSDWWITVNLRQIPEMSIEIINNVPKIIKRIF